MRIPYGPSLNPASQNPHNSLIKLLTALEHLSGVRGTNPQSPGKYRSRFCVNEIKRIGARIEVTQQNVEELKQISEQLKAFNFSGTPSRQELQRSIVQLIETINQDLKRFTQEQNESKLSATQVVQTNVSFNAISTLVNPEMRSLSLVSSNSGDVEESALGSTNDIQERHYPDIDWKPTTHQSIEHYLRHQLSFIERSATEKNASTEPSLSPVQSQNLSTFMTHFFGDSFVLNSYLEGSNSSVIRESLLYLLRLVPYSDDCKEVITNLTHALDQGILFQDTLLNKTTRDICQLLNAMASYERLILPFGWRGFPGHATYLEITKTGDRCFLARHFNLGTGCNINQKRRWDTDAKRYLYEPCSVHSQIPIDRLSSELFQKGYKELQDPSNSLGFKEMNALLTYLAPIDVQNEIFSPYYLPTQHAGVCAWYSLDALIRISLSEKNYAQFYLSTGLKLFQIFKQELYTNKTLLSLPNLEVMRLCMKSFLLQTSRFDSHYSDASKKLIKEIADDIAFFEDNFLVMTDMPDSKMSSVTPPLNWKLWMETPMPYTRPLPPDARASQATPIFIDTPQGKRLQDIENFLGNAAQVCMNRFDRPQSLDDFTQIQRIGNKIIQDLPLESEIWSQATDFKMLQHLASLSLVLRHCNIKSNEHNLQIDLALSQLHVLGIAIKIIQSPQFSEQDPVFEKWAQNISIDIRPYKTFFEPLDPKRPNNKESDPNLYIFSQYQKWHELVAFFDALPKGPSCIQYWPLQYRQEDLTNEHPLMNLLRHQHVGDNVFSLESVRAVLCSESDDACNPVTLLIRLIGYAATALLKPHEERITLNSGPTAKDAVLNIRIEQYDLTYTLCFDTKKASSKKTFARLNIPEESGILKHIVLTQSGEKRLGIEALLHDAFDTFCVKKDTIKSVQQWLPIHVLRDLLSLTSIYSDSRTYIDSGQTVSCQENLQIHKLTNVFTYFNHHQDLIATHSHKHAFQELFKILLLSPLSKDCLTFNPAFKTQITTFLNGQLENAIARQDFGSSFFFLKLMIFVAPRLESLTQDPCPPLLILETITLILSKHTPPENWRPMFHLLRVAHYGQFPKLLSQIEDPSLESIVLSASESTPLVLGALDPEMMDPNLVYLRSHALFELQSLIPTFSPDRLNCALACFTDGTKGEQWHLDPHTLVATYKDKEFHFLSGNFVISGSQKGLPDRLARHPILEYFFPGKALHTLTFYMDQSGFVFPWGDHKLHFLEVSPTVFEVTLESNGHLAIFMPPDKYSTSFIEIASHRLVTDSYIFFSDDQKIQFYAKGMLTLDAEATGIDFSLYQRQLVRLQDLKVKLTLENSPLERLLIEPIEHVECYGNPDTAQCEEIFYPRLGITLRSYTERACFYCEGYAELEGFWLDTQYVRGLSGFKDFLRLTNGQDSMLLIPVKKIMPSTHPEIFSPNKSSFIKTDKVKVFGRQYLTTDFISDTPFILIPPALVEKPELLSAPLIKENNSFKNLYLVYLFVSIGDYERAFRMISECLSDPSPPTSTETTLILDVIMKNPSINSCAEEAAVYLKLAAKYMPYLHQKGDASDALFATISKAYDTYLNFLSDNGTCRLTDEEEKTLLRKPICNTDTIKQREIYFELCALRETPTEIVPMTDRLFPLSSKQLNALEKSKISPLAIYHSTPKRLFDSDISANFSYYFEIATGLNISQKKRDEIDIITCAYPNVLTSILSTVVRHPSEFRYLTKNDLKSIVEKTIAIHRSLNVPSFLGVEESKTEQPSVAQRSLGFLELEVIPLTQPENNETAFIKEFLALILPVLADFKPGSLPPLEAHLNLNDDSDLHPLLEDRRMFLEHKKNECDLLQKCVLSSKTPLSDAQKQETFMRMLTLCKVSHTQFRKLQRQYATQALHLSNTSSPDIDIKIKNGLLSAISMDDLTRLFVHQNANAYRSLRPQLTDSQCQALHNDVFHYLQCSRQASRCFRVHELVSKIKPLGPSQQGLKQGLLTSLFDELCLVPTRSNNGEILFSYKKPFDLSKYPARVVFEHRTGFGLRPIQHRHLDTLSEPKLDNRVMLQMSMGKGKSTVFLPLLGFEKATGDRLSIVVATEALIKDVVRDLNSKSPTILGQRLEFFEFDRQTPLSEKSAKELFLRFDACRKERGLLLATSKSFHCLRLKCLELQHNLKQPNMSEKLYQEQIEILQHLKNCLRLLREKGDVTLDEGDVLLNCKNEVNFTLGASEKPPQDQLRFLVHLHRFVKNLKDADSSLTKFNFKERVKEEILKQLDSDAKVFGTTISEIFSKDSVAAMGFISASLPTLPDIFSEGEKSLLFLFRQELIDLLDTTYQKENFVSFGPDKDHQSTIEALPYVANNQQSPSSNFDQIHELLNYTIQMYQDIPIPIWIITAQLFLMRKTLIEDLSMGMSVEESSVFSQFSDLFPGIDLGQIQNDHAIPILAEQISALFQQNESCRDQYISNCILNHIDASIFSLNSNSFDLTSMFLRVQGFTGTPWNHKTFPFTIETLLDPNTDGESISILLDRPTEIRSLTPEEVKSVPHLIDSLIFKPNTRALIDAGAVFKGQTDLEIASLLFKRLQADRKDIHAIVFYHNNEKSYLVHTKQGYEIKSFDGKSFSPEQCFTLYGHLHITGADIKQTPDAEAIVTVGINLTIRSLLQGIWRMRELSQNQCVSLLVSPEVQIAIGSNHPTMAEVLRLVSQNQNAQLHKHIIHSAILQFSHLQDDENFRSFIDGDNFSDGATSFVRTKSIDPKEMYTAIGGIISKQAFIENKKSMLSGPHVEKAIAKVNQVLPDSFEFPVRPEDTETEKEQEKENEMEIQKEANTQTLQSSQDLYRWDVLTYDRLLTEASLCTILNCNDNPCLSGLNISYNICYLSRPSFQTADTLKSETITPLRYLLVSNNQYTVIHEYDLDAIMRSFTKEKGENPQGAFGVFHVGDREIAMVHAHCLQETIIYTQAFKRAALQMRLFNGCISLKDGDLTTLMEWKDTHEKRQALATYLKTCVLPLYPEKIKGFEILWKRYLTEIRSFELK